MTTDDNRPERDPALIRIGDAERESAIEALGQHLTAGRLDMDEYGGRTAAASQARTVADLRALFDDLPAPHPALPGWGPITRPAGLSPPAEGPYPRPGRPPSQWDDRAPAERAQPAAQRVAAVLLAVSGILSVLLFFLLKTWIVFLLPALIAAVTSAVWGRNWRG